MEWLTSRRRNVPWFVTTLTTSSHFAYGIPSDSKGFKPRTWVDDNPQLVYCSHFRFFGSIMRNKIE
jgi:hypothetical protein